MSHFHPTHPTPGFARAAFWGGLGTLQGHAGGFVGSNLAHAQRRHTVIALSALEDVALGGFAGAMACAAGTSLLTLKFCSQAGQPLPTAFLEWYRGVAVQALSAAPVAGVPACQSCLLLRFSILCVSMLYVWQTSQTSAQVGTF